MRQRIIKPGFFTDETLCALPPHARLLFAGLWGLADRRGRLKDQPPVIRGQVFPYEPEVDVDSLLESLQDAGSVLRYEVEGKKYIQVKNFEREQKPHPRETESQIPEVPPFYRPEPRKGEPEASLRRDKVAGIRSFVPSESVPSKPSAFTTSAALARRDDGQKAPVPISDQTDQQACVTVWVEVMGEGSLGTATAGKNGHVTYRGGMSPPRIAQSLVPLMKNHGRDHVLRNWRRYLQQRDRRFLKPEDFASKYLQWASAARIEPAATNAERVDEAAARGIARAESMGGDMRAFIDQVFPRKETSE